jgi:hypothetical protein
MKKAQVLCKKIDQAKAEASVPTNRLETWVKYKQSNFQKFPYTKQNIIFYMYNMILVEKSF